MSTHTGMIDSLVGQNHDPQLRAFAVKCFEAGLDRERWHHRTILDAVQMICQGASIETLADESKNSVTVQDVSELRKRAVNLFHALEMVRASIDNVSCLKELDRRIRKDLQQISRFIDLTLQKEKP